MKEMWGSACFYGGRWKIVVDVWLKHKNWAGRRNNKHQVGQFNHLCCNRTQLAANNTSRLTSKILRSFKNTLDSNASPIQKITSYELYHPKCIIQNVSFKIYQSKCNIQNAAPEQLYRKKTTFFFFNDLTFYWPSN